MSGTIAVIPIRGSHGAKTRLSGAFTEQERARLVWHMFAHVLAAVEQSRAVDHVLVVTREPAAVDCQAGEGSRRTVLFQPAERPGLNAALDLGREWARAYGYERMIALPADLPTLTALDVRRLVGQDSPVVIGPDRHGTGTNALVLQLDDAADPEQSFFFHFGGESRMRHVDEAHRLGMGVSTVFADGVQLDLDTPEDWVALPASNREFLLAIVNGSVVPSASCRETYVGACVP